MVDEEIQTRNTTFSSKPISGTAPHHQIANTYRQLPVATVHYRQITGIYVTFTISMFTATAGIYRQGWLIYHGLPPVMKNYRHAGNVVMVSRTSNSNIVLRR